MSALYNEYLTGAEREAAIIVAESEAQFAKLNVLLETVDATLEANMLAAEAKVFAENGTYDDLTMLYKEAGEEADKKNRSVFAAIFGAIKNFFKKIGDFFKTHFGNGEIPAQVEVPSDFPENMNIFERAWNNLKSGIAKIKAGQIKEGCLLLLKVAFPTALTAGVATATTVAVVKREQIKAWIDGLKVKQEEVESATADAEKAINTGSAILDVASAALGGSDSEQNTDDKKTKGQAIKDSAKKVIGFTKETAQKALALLKKFGQWIINALGKIKNWISGKFKYVEDAEISDVAVPEKKQNNKSKDNAPKQNVDAKKDTSSSENDNDDESNEKPDDGKIVMPSDEKLRSMARSEIIEDMIAKGQQKKTDKIPEKVISKKVAEIRAEYQAKIKAQNKEQDEEDWHNSVHATESAFLDDIISDSDETCFESVMTEEEYSELCELFSEL